MVPEGWRRATRTGDGTRRRSRRLSAGVSRGACPGSPAGQSRTTVRSYAATRLNPPPKPANYSGSGDRAETECQPAADADRLLSKMRLAETASATRSSGRRRSGLRDAGGNEAGATTSRGSRTAGGFARYGIPATSRSRGLSNVLALFTPSGDPTRSTGRTLHRFSPPDRPQGDSPMTALRTTPGRNGFRPVARISRCPS
jgi:hypothetical protein